MRYAAPGYLSVRNRGRDAVKTAPNPAMEILAWITLALVLPRAVAMVFFAPNRTPWVRARIMLGPGMMDATKIVVR